MSIATDSVTERLISELYAVESKAEIVGGQVVMMGGSGDMPSSAAATILVSLRLHAKRIGGRAYGDNSAFLVDLPNRKSFNPDAAYYTGPRTKMKFLSEAPVFAAEVQSENDYGRPAEREMAAKRADYFAAGTKVVWDVDLLSDELIRVYRAGTLETPTIYRCDEMAEAEPAVPGWKFVVNELFD